MVRFLCKLVIVSYSRTNLFPRIIGGFLAKELKIKKFEGKILQNIKIIVRNTYKLKKKVLFLGFLLLGWPVLKYLVRFR